MIDAGLPLVQCLDILSKQAENKIFSKAIVEIKKEVEGGTTFADALRKYPKIFDDLYVNLVQAGEIAGLDADAGVNFSVFVSNDSGNETISSTSAINDVDVNGLALTGLTIAAQGGAQTAITNITAAIATLGSVQGQVGQLQNRLQFAMTLAQSQMTNKKAAESRIRDANVAEESANMTRFNILSQTGIAALAQANQASASVLSLLR
jgi:flagellin-like hook-associated protein FlgL